MVSGLVRAALSMCWRAGVEQGILRDAVIRLHADHLLLSLLLSLSLLLLGRRLPFDLGRGRPRAVVNLVARACGAGVRSVCHGHSNVVVLGPWQHAAGLEFIRVDGRGSKRWCDGMSIEADSERSLRLTLRLGGCP